MRSDLRNHRAFARRERPRPWRIRLYTIIFEADTRAGKTFDVVLIGSIVCSVLVVLLDSVKSLQNVYGELFRVLEWVFTLLFLVEYMLRLAVVGRPMIYATSFFGLVDLFAIVPTFLSLLFPVTRYFRVIRILRLLRIFRVLKLVQYLNEAKYLTEALKSSRRKITLFIFTVLTMVVILGSLMYVIEGDAGQFTSIPRSIYWAIVTLTTVGYGDISPQTGLGQAVAAVIMILGYSIIAVPTGIVTAHLMRTDPRDISARVCPSCSTEGHDADARYCKTCGDKLS